MMITFIVYLIDFNFELNASDWLYVLPAAHDLCLCQRIAGVKS